jgi:diacylglycerol kinase (ATP)
LTWWGVVNPGAGDRTGTFARVEEALAERSIDVAQTETESPDHQVELVAQGIEGGHRRFLATGGDGTVNLVADTLLRHDWSERPILAVLPTGSGCDLIRTFGISQRLTDAADRLVGEGTAELDAGHLRGSWGDRYFLNSAGTGLTASVVEHAERFPSRLGGLRYQLAIWPALIKFPHSEVEITSPGGGYQGQALMVVISNARYLAGGMNMAPHADPADGEVNIQIFTGPKRSALVLKPMIQRGKHLTHRNVRQIECAEFTIRTDPEWPAEADGEYLGWGELQGSVVPRALLLKV